MADPELVAYLRTTVPRFGEQAVREKLLEEGVSGAEIDAAWAIAKQAARPRRARMAALGICLAAIGCALLYGSLQKAGPGVSPPAAPPPAAARIAAPAPVAPKGPFLGHYGYMLQVAPGYGTQTTFKDLGNRTEVVYFFPEKTDPTNFGNEGLYGQLGIMRLEVSPLRIPGGTIGIDSLRAGIRRTLDKRGDTYQLSDATIDGLPGFVVKIVTPFPLVQAFVVGSKVLYVLTAGVDDPVFRNTLQSLTEIAPRDTQAPPS